MNHRKVIPVWKRIGQSTHNISKALADKYKVKTAHTGILDPMAEGVVVVLMGEERFEKDKYTATKKVYEVEVLTGISTDTHDLLGLVEDEKDSVKLDRGKVESALSQFVGKQDQMPPDFSAISYRGKRLFQYAKDGSLKNILVSPRQVNVFDIKLFDVSEISKAALEERVESAISLISGDFRQEEILERWRDYFDRYQDKIYQIFNISITCGRGYYVRAFVRDLGFSLSVPLVVYSLVRKENAGFSKEDCVYINNLL